MKKQGLLKRSENKQIAKFMGVEPEGDWFDGMQLSNVGLPFSYGAMGNGTNELKFHISWDWLMPVIQKINKIIGNKPMDECTPEEISMKMYLGIDIQHAHFYVVEFLNRYNKQKTNIQPIKIDFSGQRRDIFYSIIYPLMAKEFLFGNNYEVFAEKVGQKFILNSQQWEYILEYWEEKESILKID